MRPGARAAGIAGVSSDLAVARVGERVRPEDDETDCDDDQSRRAVRVLGQEIEREYSLFDLLRRPKTTYAGLMSLEIGESPLLDRAVTEQVEIAAKYQGYIDRQQEEVAKNRTLEDTRLPADIDYTRLRGLSNEVQLKLNLHKPETIGQAARIQGVTPAAVSLLLVHVKRGFATARITDNRQSA